IGPAEVDVCAQAVKEIWDDKTKKGKQGTETVKGIASIVEEVRDFDRKNTSKKGTSDGKDAAAGQPESEQVGDKEAVEEGGAKKKPKRPAQSVKGDRGP